MTPVSSPGTDGPEPLAAQADPPAPGLDAEYRQIREECALYLPEDRSWLAVDGPDAAAFLHGQVTNDVEGLEPGGWCEALLLTRKGRIEAGLRVLRPAEDEFLLETTTDRLPAVLKHLDMYRIGHRVEVGESSLTTVSLLGPVSADVLGHSPGPAGGAAAITFAGAACLAIPTDDGIDLACPSEAASAVREELKRKRAIPVSAAAVEIVRVEAGRPRIGRDTGETTMPAEAGLVERTVSFGTGCYIGQEPVVRLAHRGRPNRHLRGLRFRGAATAGDVVRLGERELGTVTTAVVSPAHGRIGLAILRREAEPGDTVTVGEAGAEAVVVELPFTGTGP